MSGFKPCEFIRWRKLASLKTKKPSITGGFNLQSIDLKRVVALQHCQLYEVKQK